MSQRALFYAFVLAFLLIAAVYFVGVATDARSLGAAINQLVLSLTGRTASGKFADYPSSSVKLQGGL